MRRTDLRGRAAPDRPPVAESWSRAHRGGLLRNRHPVPVSCRALHRDRGTRSDRRRGLKRIAKATKRSPDRRGLSKWLRRPSRPVVPEDLLDAITEPQGGRGSRRRAVVRHRDNLESKSLENPRGLATATEVLWAERLGTDEFVTISRSQQSLGVVVPTVLNDEVLSGWPEAVLAEEGFPPNLVELGDRCQDSLPRSHIPSVRHQRVATLSDEAAARRFPAQYNAGLRLIVGRSEWLGRPHNPLGEAVDTRLAALQMSKPPISRRPRFPGLS